MHPQQQQQGQQQQGSATGAGSGPAGKKKLGAVKSDPVAERRKQKAMAVLDERLKAMEKDHQQTERAKAQGAGKGEGIVARGDGVGRSGVGGLGGKGRVGG